MERHRLQRPCEVVSEMVPAFFSRIPSKPFVLAERDVCVIRWRRAAEARSQLSEALQRRTSNGFSRRACRTRRLASCGEIPLFRFSLLMLVFGCLGIVPVLGDALKRRAAYNLICAPRRDDARSVP